MVFEALPSHLPVKAQIAPMPPAGCERRLQPERHLFPILFRERRHGAVGTLTV